MVNGVIVVGPVVFDGARWRQTPDEKAGPVATTPLTIDH